MNKEEFKTIHEIGYSALLERLKPYRGGGSEKSLSHRNESATLFDLTQVKETNLLTASGVYLEGVHFDLVYTPLKHLGFKLLTASVNNILAMNGRPKFTRVDMAVPNKISAGMVEEIFKGFDNAGKHYACAIQPGEITASHQLLTISVQSTGAAGSASVVYRDGGKPGDQICVSGDLGGAMAGLRILLREKQAWQESGDDSFQPDLEEYEYVVQRQLMPSARIDLIECFLSTGIKPTSMIGVSKGLLNELQFLTEAAGTGCEVFSPAVPIALETRSVADEMKEDVDRYAFYGGEDYEMIFTLNPEDVEKLNAEYEDFAVIGEMKPKEQGIRIQTGEDQSREIS